MAAKPLDISRLLRQAPKNRIGRIGVELEGGWKQLPDGAHLERDGSVFGDQGVPGFKCGELPIGPMQPAAMPKFMKKYYPQKVDSTCGMHVHMSFESLRHYAWLMVPEYQETICEYLIQWAKDERFSTDHHIWGRLKGESIYCQKKFWPDEQVSYKKKDHDHNRDGHRYTIVHYCGRMLTIEVRVLPMMVTADQAIRAVKQVLDITNASLVLLADRNQKITEKMDVNETEIYEEIIEEEIGLTAAQRRRLR